MSGSSSIVNDPDLAFDHENCRVWEEMMGYEGKKDVSKAVGEECKRQNAVYEAVNSERTYLKNLKILKHVYQEPLLNLVTKDVCNRIFPNLDELIELHKSFTEEMLKLPDPENHNMYPEVGEVIAKFINQPILLKEYIKFCTNGQAPFVTEQLKNEKFAELIQECQNVSAKNYGQRNDFKSVLMGVTQRSMRISMLAEKILKYTAEGTAEFDLLTQCHEKAVAFADSLNAAKAEAEDSRVEKTARGWLINRRKSMSLKPGDCQMNYSASLAAGDTKNKINVILYDNHLVLFPSDEATMYNAVESETKGKSKSKTKSDVNIQSIEFEDNNVHVSKSEDPCKFFIVATSKSDQTETKVYTIVCEPVPDAAAEVKERNERKAREKSEKIFRALSKACAAHAASNQDGNQLDESMRTIADLDSEILALLAAKLDIMVGQSIPTGVKDFTQSVTQLTFDAETLHTIAAELLQSYTGDDKDGKSAKVSASFKSMLTNISGVTSGYQTGGAQQEIKKEPGFFKKVRQSIYSHPKKNQPTNQPKVDKNTIGGPELQHTTNEQVDGARDL